MNRLSNLIPLLVLFFPTVSPAQSVFEKTIGGLGSDEAYSVQETHDGGFIIAGTTTSPPAAGMGDLYLIRTDEFGNVLWMKTYGDSLEEQGRFVLETADSGFAVAGFVESWGAGDKDMSLLKTDENGELQWIRTYGDSLEDVATVVVEHSDGRFLVAGYTCGFPDSCKKDVYWILTDENGDEIPGSAYAFGGPDDDGVQSAQETIDNGFIVSGFRSNMLEAGSQRDLFLTKAESSGDTLWTRAYGGLRWDEGNFVQQTADSGYVIAGLTGSFQDTLSDLYLIKTNANGDSMWARTYGGAGADEGHSVRQLADGGYLMAGSTESFGAGGVDVYVVRTDAEGDTIWTRTYGGPGEDLARSLTLTRDRGYVLAGLTASFGAGGNDVYLIKDNERGPIPTSASATDNQDVQPGIDDDDQVIIAFDEPTEKPYLDAHSIDDVLRLSDGHSWRDGSGAIGGVVWSVGGDTLTITLSTAGGAPTLALGDSVIPDGVTITDRWGDPVTDPVVVDGEFGPVDTIPPAGIVDLTAGSVTETTITLTWSAPGDDSLQGGPVDQYFVRISTLPIDTSNFSQADSLPFPAPFREPTEPETLRVTGLQSETLYYFAIRTEDEADNPSPMSNVASAATPGTAFNFHGDVGLRLKGNSDRSGSQVALFRPGTPELVDVDTTDSSGIFVFPELIRGEYDIVASHPGFLSERRGGTPVEEDDLSIDFALRKLGDMDSDSTLLVNDLVRLVSLVLGDPGFDSMDSLAGNVNEDTEPAPDIGDVIALQNEILRPSPVLLEDQTVLSAPMMVRAAVSQGEGGGLGVSVGVAGTQEVSGLELSFRYDPSQYKLGEVSRGPDLEGMTLAFRDDDGQVTILLYGTGNLAGGAGSTACRLEFQPLAFLSQSATGILLQRVKISAPTGDLLAYFLEGTGEGGGIDLPTPRAYRLYQNYPNPFNPSTTIVYDIPTGSESVDVSLWIYDVRGRLVRRLVENNSRPGRYAIQWDGRSDLGERVSSGTYFYRIASGTFSATRKLVLLK